MESSDFNLSELNIIPECELRHRNLSGSAVSSLNSFMNVGIKTILTTGFKLDFSVTKGQHIQEGEKIKVYVTFENPTTEPPTYVHFQTGKQEILSPNVARQTGRTYGSKLSVDINAVISFCSKNGTTRERTFELKKIMLATFPIAVGTDNCSTHNKSIDNLIRMEEDPLDISIGGYFIIKGVEWVINVIESKAYNMYMIFYNRGYSNESSRLEIISKRGDGVENSSELKIMLLTNGQIVVNINRLPLSEVQIPFFVILRILGWETDEEIIDWITYGCTWESDEYSKSVSVSKLIATLSTAFNAKYPFFDKSLPSHDRAELLTALSKKVTSYKSYDTTNSHVNQWVSNSILHNIDMYLLPHVGSLPENRIEKAIMLSIYIRDLISVENGTLKPTDRDSLRIKRFHSAGMSLSKTFKQQFGFVVSQVIKNNVTRELKNNPFDTVELGRVIKQSINTNDFERALAQAVTTGTKSQISLKSGKFMTNHLAAQQVDRSNFSSFVASINQINTPASAVSKSAQRAKDMRMEHPSRLGFTGCIKTSDGEGVGTKRPGAISSSITSGSSSVVLFDIILADPDILHIAKIVPKTFRNSSMVYVNGHLMGCVLDPYKFKDKYVAIRRAGGINRETGIFYDIETNKLMFEVDSGRMVRPLLIVYNNFEEWNKSVVKNIKAKKKSPAADDEASEEVGDVEFKQWVRVTKQHLTGLRDGSLTLDNLVEEGIIEYISASEQENLLLAISHDIFSKNQNNSLLRYTHCDIPISILSITTLLCPYGAHNPTGRIHLATNQFSQAMGWYSFNSPFRMDHIFFQVTCEVPIVGTIANSYLPPNGQNCVVAVMCWGGYNQEDSTMWNRASIERGLFDGFMINIVTAELDRGEYLGNPDPLKTSGMKVNGNYEKIKNGIPTIGTYLLHDDIVIGCYIKSVKTKNYMFEDRSILLGGRESGYVVDVIKIHNGDGKLMVKVKIQVMRPIEIGDKLSMRSGQKGVCGLKVNEWDMPRTASGIVPDVIFNPFGLPSRMTLSLFMEAASAKIASQRGDLVDGTIFNKTDPGVLKENLKALGFSHKGTEVMYNSMNGKKLDVEIFLAPVFYQRLKKFSADQYQVAPGPNPIDILTRQPIEGRSVNGGLKLGHMEQNVLVVNGVGRFLQEKMFDHSDGYVDYLCNTCGKAAIKNMETGMLKCKRCGDAADIKQINTSWCSKSFFQILESCGIGVNRHTIPPNLHDGISLPLTD